MDNQQKNKRIKPDAEVFLDKQLEIKNKTKLCDFTAIVFFCIFILAFTVAFWLVPDKEFSETENKSLSQMPKISVNNFISGNLTNTIGTYFSDQFPLRDNFRSIKAVCELTQLKRENDGVVVTTDGYLIKGTTAKSNTAAKDTIKKNLTYLELFQNNLEKANIPLYTAIAGRGVDVLSYKLPSFYPVKEISEDYFTTLNENSKLKNLIDLKTVLKEKAEDGEYVYYKTDHHWTTKGAYYAYCEIIKSMGKEPLDISEFDIEEVSNEFYGTNYSTAGAGWVEADKLQYFRYSGDEAYHFCEVFDGANTTSFPGFYDRSYLSKKDKYSSFISGNNPLTKITKTNTAKTGENRETLIVVKDSFAHSVAPFLAYHYDLILVDLRYYDIDITGPSITQLGKENNASAILVLYNMETFSNEKNLSKAAF